MANVIKSFELRKETLGVGGSEGFDVVVENQFGAQELRVRKTKTLCVPSLKAVVGPSPKDDDDDDDDGDD